MEVGMVPPDPAITKMTVAAEVDPRGGVAVIAAMVAIGLWSLRPAPAPAIPARVASVGCEEWMADALPGVGVKTRHAIWQLIQHGDRQRLPERTRAMATQVFTW